MGVRLANPYKKTFNKSILLAATLSITEFKRIGVYTALAQEAVALGYGQLAAQDSAIGRIYMALLTAADKAIDGEVRIEIQNAKDRTIAVVYEGRTERLRTYVTNPSVQQMETFPMMRDVITEDNKIVILMKGDAADLIDVAKSTLLMDATMFDAVG